jgi:hypothetical protein
VSTTSSGQITASGTVRTETRNTKTQTHEEH